MTTIDTKKLRSETFLKIGHKQAGSTSYSPTKKMLNPVQEVAVGASIEAPVGIKPKSIPSRIRKKAEKLKKGCFNELKK